MVDVQVSQSSGVSYNLEHCTCLLMAARPVVLHPGSGVDMPGTEHVLLLEPHPSTPHVRNGHMPPAAPQDGKKGEQELLQEMNQVLTTGYGTWHV
jgi:hypothetical protein